MDIRPVDRPDRPAHDGVVATLREFDLLADVAPGDLRPLAVLLEPIRASPGQVLMQRGDRAEFFLLVTSGQVRIVTGSDEAERTVLVGPGSIVGEIALLRGEPRTSTVTATASTAALQGGPRAFSVLLDIPGVLDNVVRRARQRLAADVDPVGVAIDDGTIVAFRPVYPADKWRLMEAGSASSVQTRYRRFFSAADIPQATARYLTEVDYVDHFAWAAIDAGGVAIGGASYVRSAVDPALAEISFVITDEFQGRGLGTRLMGALAVAAPRAGICRFCADVLAENRPMLAILGRAGIEWEPTTGPVLHGVAAVPDPARFAIAADIAEALGALVDEVASRAWHGLVTPTN